MITAIWKHQMHLEEKMPTEILYVTVYKSCSVSHTSTGQIIRHPASSQLST